VAENLVYVGLTCEIFRQFCLMYFAKFRPALNLISPSKARRSTVAEFSA